MKNIYAGWLRLYETWVDGRRYEVLASPDAVAVWLIDNHGRVLLVEQFRPAVDRLTWEIPAGVLDKEGKTPLEVLIEEIEEECELSIKAGQIKHLVTYRPQMGHNTSSLSIYQGVYGGPVFEEKKVADVDVLRVRWWPLDEIKEAIGTQHLVDAKTLMAYYCYLAQLNESVDFKR